MRDLLTKILQIIPAPSGMQVRIHFTKGRTEVTVPVLALALVRRESPEFNSETKYEQIEPCVLDDAPYGEEGTFRPVLQAYKDVDFVEIIYATSI